VLHRSLMRHKFNAVCLHGDMDQPARTAALDQFRRGEATLLIASDVAARGLDIPAVSHVFNFDVPHHADDYIHRIGRTGRAGLTGIAITIASSADHKAVAAIEKLTGQKISRLEMPAGMPDVVSSEPESGERQRDGQGRGEGRGERKRGERGGRGERGKSERNGGERNRGERNQGEPRGHKIERPARPAETPDRPAVAAAVPTKTAAVPTKTTASVADIEEARSRRRPARESAEDEAALSRLPAFLLRPTRIKA
jgi:superfamily II DNA/RNA helicase